MPGGRPPLFETPEELERKIEGYFGFFKDKITITGLAFYLGFESRQSFYDYEKREEFSYIIRRAKDVEWERRKAAVDAAMGLLKEREEFLRTLKEPLTAVDTDSGEVFTISPPLKTSKSGVKVKFT